MKIRALAPWFGSKRTMAADICAELGQHAAYWEPFCGSAAIVLNKPRSQQETINDLQADLINLAVVVASDRAADLFERCARTLYAEEILAIARRVISAGPAKPAENFTAVGDEHVDRAYHYFVLSWMGRNGLAGCLSHTEATMSIRWTPNGGHSPTRFAAAVESIPAWHKRLQNVCPLNRDAFDVLSKIDDHPAAAIYVDPPYFKETRGNGGGSVYEFDFEETQHVELAELLGRFKQARVVLSYYESPRLAELYPGWTKRDMARAKNLSNQVADRSIDGIAPEVLLINGPSYAAAQRDLF